MLRREYVGRVTGHSLVAAWDLLPMRGGEARATPLRQKFWFANATRCALRVRLTAGPPHASRAATEHCPR